MSQKHRKILMIFNSTLTSLLMIIGQILILLTNDITLESLGITFIIWSMIIIGLSIGMSKHD